MKAEDSQKTRWGGVRWQLEGLDEDNKVVNFSKQNERERKKG